MLNKFMKTSYPKENEMKHKYMVLLSALAVVLVLTAFVAGKASASTGCFTDTTGHWAETFICFLKDNGITSGTAPGIYSPESNVTRAQMAVLMQRLDELAVSQAKAYTDTSLSTGKILISSGFGNWRPFNSTDPITFVYTSVATEVLRSTTGVNYLSISPDLPTVLYGKSLKLSGVEFCYTASASAFLSYVEINTYTHSTAPDSRTLQFTDFTDRTDTACRLYTLATPVVLTAEDGANFYIQVNWTVASASFDLGRTTFILEATSTTAVAPLKLETLGTDLQTPLLPGTDSPVP